VEAKQPLESPCDHPKQAGPPKEFA